MATGSQPAVPQQGAQPGQDPQNQGQDAMNDFRTFAQAGTELAKKYPEATEGMTTILREIQKMMVRVAGNPQRTPQQQAPPQAG